MMWKTQSIVTIVAMMLINADAQNNTTVTTGAGATVTPIVTTGAGATVTPIVTTGAGATVTPIVTTVATATVTPIVTTVATATVTPIAVSSVNVTLPPPPTTPPPTTPEEAKTTKAPPEPTKVHGSLAITQFTPKEEDDIVNNPSSDKTKNLKKDITATLLKILKNVLDILISLRKGSIIVEFVVTFNVSVPIADVQNTVTGLKTQIETGTFGNFTVDKDSFKVEKITGSNVPTTVPSPAETTDASPTSMSETLFIILCVALGVLVVIVILLIVMICCVIKITKKQGSSN